MLKLVEITVAEVHTFCAQSIRVVLSWFATSTMKYYTFSRVWGNAIKSFIFSHGLSTLSESILYRGANKCCNPVPTRQYQEISPSHLQVPLQYSLQSRVVISVEPTYHGNTPRNDECCGGFIYCTVLNWRYFRFRTVSIPIPVYWFIPLV